MTYLTEEYRERIRVVVHECLEIFPVLNHLPHQVFRVDSEQISLVALLDCGHRPLQRNEPMAMPAVTRAGQLYRTTLEPDFIVISLAHHLHLLNLLLGDQLLVQIGGLSGEGVVELRADPRQGQNPAQVQIAENFLLQLQLCFRVLPSHVGGEVEADVVSVRKKTYLEKVVLVRPCE